MVKKKTMLFTVLGLILILFILGIAYSTIGNKVNTASIHIKDIAVANNKLQIIGTTTNSGLAFTSNDYKIVNDSIFLVLRYAIVNPLHRSGDFNIMIEDNLAGVSKVYLKGSDEQDLQLVWRD